SSAFLGFTDSLAAATYIYGDSPTPSEICSFPLRACGSGNLYGGNEPARTWFTAIKGVSGEFPPPVLPPLDDKYVRGANNAQVPATRALTSAGFQVSAVDGSGPPAKGSVTSMAPNGSAIPGSVVTIYISDGTQREVPTPSAPAPGPAPAPPPALPNFPLPPWWPR